MDKKIYRLFVYFNHETKNVEAKLASFEIEKETNSYIFLKKRRHNRHIKRLEKYKLDKIQINTSIDFTNSYNVNFWTLDIEDLNKYINFLKNLLKEHLKRKRE